MSPNQALHNPIFRAYLLIVIAILVVAALVLVILQKAMHRNLRSVWTTYRGWLAMVPLVTGCIFAGRGTVIVGSTLLAVFGFKEFAKATGLYRDWWMTGAVYAAIAAVSYASFMDDPFKNTPGWFGLFLALPVYAISFLLVIPILRNRTRGQLQELALSILGFIYIGWMFGHLGFLANSSNPYGYLLFVILATELNDVAAFTFGRLFGRHKLRSNISPNKTVEGALGALCVSLCVPWLLRFSLPEFTTRELIFSGLIVGIGGQLGDLSVSVIKRDIGLKDMGGTIPGHGGILDRIDSLIFVAPLFLHMVQYCIGLRQF
jgi:phosphatidate cytidylyltransferase